MPQTDDDDNNNDLKRPSFKADSITSLSSSSFHHTQLLRSDTGAVPLSPLSSSSSFSGLPLTPLAAQTVVMSHDRPQSNTYGWQNTTQDSGSSTDLPGPLIGRSIMNMRSMYLEEEQRSPGLQPPRRRPPSAQTAASSTRTTRPSHGSRRNSRASINSSSSSRRTSLPALHLHQAPTTAATSTASSLATSPTMSGHPPRLPGEDDMYSSLSSFTFGAASAVPSAYDADTEMIGPLQTPTVFARKASVDRTPRPSVSGASGSSRRREIASDGSDEDAHRREVARGKMRAVDVGGRRPSLPTNNTHLSPKERNSGHTSSASDAEPDSYHGDLDLDTDVEFELPSRPHDSDTASVNTFGGGSERFARPPPQLRVQHMSGDESDGSQRQQTLSADILSPLKFAPRESDDELSPMSPRSPRSSRPGQHRVQQQHVDIAPWDDEPPMAGSSVYTTASMSPGREREGSQATVRRRSQSMDAAERTSLSVGFDPLQSTDEGVYTGFDLKYILGDTGGSRRPSTTSQFDRHPGTMMGRGQDSRQSASGGGFGFWARDYRRGSTATRRSVGSDDAFMRHIINNDDDYKARKIEWSFRKEKAEGDRDLVRVGSVASHASDLRGKAAVQVGRQEIWRCDYVGRFKADRTIFRADASKPVQQRLTVRHIIDPFSKGNTRGGPNTLIHKHSRAIAFSIFREHDLAGISRGRTNQMSVNMGILLATKRVQEQYTSTKTTSKLNSHGLLDDRGSRPNSTTPHGVLRPRSQSRSHKDRDKDKKKSKGKERERDHHRHPSPLADSEPSSSRARGQPPAYRAVSAPAEQHGSPDRAMDSPSPTTSTAVSTAVSTSASARNTRSPSPGLLGRSPSQTTAASESSTYPPTEGSTYSQSFISEQSTYAPYDYSRSLLSRERSVSIELDEGTHVPRTSHREAFATLDSNYFDTVRNRPDRPEVLSLGEKLRRLVAGPSRSGVSGGSSGHSTRSDGRYSPPWITMAPRIDQEEHERVIQNLNESFKDVGLLPSIDTKKRAKPKPRPGRSLASDDVFKPVPDDALFMLVPLWPKDTEPAFAEDSTRFQITNEERQYLLVYYCKAEKSKHKKGREERKGRDSAASADAAAENDPSQLKTFHVSARVVGYQQLRNSGVRCPSFGISVTGSMQAAMDAIPPAEIREREYDPVVIAIWHGREDGLELMPEALEKFGLCEPRGGTHPDEAIPLNSLGRAAIEMTWLGGMALTSFPLIAGQDG